MNNHDFGRLEKLEPRNYWANEASKFNALAGGTSQYWVVK